MKFTNLTPVIGAEVSEIDIVKPLSADAVAQLKSALADRVALFFRDQDFDAQSFAAFASQFGEIGLHPFANKRPSDLGPVMAYKTDAQTRVALGDLWHTDQSQEEKPTSYTALYITKIPESGGGDTVFADMRIAYETLSPRFRDFVETLTAFHSGIKPDKGYIAIKVEKVQLSEHPIVIRHPASNRPALFCNPGTLMHIPQLEWHESEAVLSALWKHVLNPRFQCRFKWSANSLAIWDNRVSMHHAVWDYYPQTREGLRLIVKGERLIPAFPEKCQLVGSGLERLKRLQN